MTWTNFKLAYGDRRISFWFPLMSSPTRLWKYPPQSVAKQWRPLQVVRWPLFTWTVNGWPSLPQLVCFRTGLVIFSLTSKDQLYIGQKLHLVKNSTVHLFKSSSRKTWSKLRAKLRCWKPVEAFKLASMAKIALARPVGRWMVNDFSSISVKY